MSSFEDTFTRNNDKDLQYDDSAFYIFMSSIVFFINLYYFIKIIRILINKKDKKQYLVEMKKLIQSSKSQRKQ